MNNWRKGSTMFTLLLQTYIELWFNRYVANCNMILFCMNENFYKNERKILLTRKPKSVHVCLTDLSLFYMHGGGKVEQKIDEKND